MLVTVSKLAELTGIDRRSINRRLSGLEPVGKAGRAVHYDSAKALPKLYHHGSDLLDAAQERAALDRSRRELVDLQLDRQAAELVEIGEVQHVIGDAAATLKRRLADLPLRPAAGLATLTDVAEIQRRIEAEARELLVDFSERMTRAAKPTTGRKH